MGDLNFQSYVPDPLLSEKESLTFKFKVEKIEGKVFCLDRRQFGACSRAKF
jgi:hypothetical protein